MKVILLSDVKSQGKKDQIIDVKDGYAKYLISSKLAVLYTSKSSEILKCELKIKKDEEEMKQSQAEEIKKKLEKVKLKFIVKTGEKDKIFGSVTSKNINEELKKLGFEIDKKKIKLNGDINTLGMHEIEIELHKKVICKLIVQLSK